MSNIAVLGAMWGDEGKGHITHWLSPRYNWVVRFNGGANAGHTIYRDGKKFIHNLLPSVDFRSETTKAFLGAGMVIDPAQLLKEVSEAQGEYPGVAKRIYVDPDAFVVLPEHKEIDKQTNKHIGSTHRGIGPAYADKIGRRGKRIKDLFASSLDLALLREMGVNFKHVMELDPEFNLQSILFEGAQGILLDINHGIYPYVSCSDCTVGGIRASGFNQNVDKVFGVLKAYTTKVGEGPFPTEIHGKEAEDLRKRGNEFGSTTGRPRRVGWLDLPALRYACRKGGITNLVVTKFDILNGMEEVPVCTHYERNPVCPADFFSAEPIYEKVSGWDNCERGGLQPLVSKIEHHSRVEVSYLSCGTDAKDIVSA
jgi:adenylosuccinate synthase